MLNKIKSVYGAYSAKKEIKKSTSRLEETKNKRKLYIDIYQYCTEERSVKDISDKFNIRKDYARVAIKDLVSRKKLAERSEIVNGYRYKLVKQA